MHPNFKNYFFLSDIAGICDKNPYVDIEAYQKKYVDMFANSGNKESHDVRGFRTIQKIFKEDNKCFKSFLINHVNLSPVQVLDEIKKTYPEVEKTSLYDYFIICQFNRIRGKETEQDSISLILKNYKYQLVEIEKEIKIRFRGLNFKGRVDLLAINPKGLKRLIEIKNRTMSYRTLSAYEIYQLNLYMYAIGYRKSRLIEVLNGNTRCTTVHLNVQLVLDALNKLESFFYTKIKDIMNPKNNFDVVIYQLYDIHRFSLKLNEIFDNVRYFNKFNYRKTVL